MLWPLNSFEQKVEGAIHKDRTRLMHALIFPLNFAFVVTFLSSRALNYIFPNLYLQLTPTLHVHHFTYGVFIVAIAAWLALLFNGPKAKFFIALFLGIGLGLAFDEFAMWLRLSDNDPIRWNYDGFLIIMSVCLILFTVPEGILLIKHVWKKELRVYKKRLKHK